MKIVRTDNFAREHISERLVAENIQNKEEAEVMIGALIDKLTSHSGPNWYKLVDDDYKLHEFEP